MNNNNNSDHNTTNNDNNDNNDNDNNSSNTMKNWGLYSAVSSARAWGLQYNTSYIMHVYTHTHAYDRALYYSVVY